MSINEDYFFPVTAEGRGSSVDVLPGGANVGEVTDLALWNNKLIRGLMIPSSYLPTQDNDVGGAYNDGKSTTALIQEWRFNQYCKRLQSLIIDPLDQEFKMFLRWRGFNIDNSLFELRFNEPQNFAKYRQIELDSSRIQAFTQLESIGYLSKRFLLKRYLDLSEEEMQENDKLWAEENGDLKKVSTESDNLGLRSVGVTPGAIESDLDNVAMDTLPGEEGDMGDMGSPEDAGINMGAPSPTVGAEPTATPPAGL